MSPPSWCAQNIEPITYVFWSITVAAVLFNVIFNVSGTMKLRQQPKISRLFKTLYIAINILFIISCVLCTTHIGQSLFCSTYFSWSTTGVTGCMFYNWGLAVLYLLYLYRLKETFDETRFGVSRLMFIVLWFGFILQLIIPCIMSIFFLKNGTTIDARDWQSAVLCYVASMLSNFIFNVLLLYVFIRKVLLLIECTYERDTSSKLLYPAIRYAICAFISMVSSNILSILGLWRSFVEDTMTIYALNIMLIVLDQSVNSAFLFLQFPFADKKYAIYCSKIHKWIHQEIATHIGCYSKQDAEALRKNVTISVSTNDTSGGTGTTTINQLRDDKSRGVLQSVDNTLP